MYVQITCLEHHNISLSKSTSYSCKKPIHIVQIIIQYTCILYKTLQVHTIKTT